MRVPGDVGVPMAVYASTPLRISHGRLASVSTLLTIVGLPYRPIAAGKYGGFRPRHAAVALEALDQRRLLADDVRAGAPVQHDVDAEVGAEDVLADVAGRVRLVERRGDALLGERHLAADVQEALRQARRVAGDEAALDQLVRIELHQQAVLVGARLALVAVDDEVARPHGLRGEAPLDAGREAGAAAAEHRRVLDVVVDVDRRLGQRGLQALVAVGGEEALERVARRRTGTAT